MEIVNRITLNSLGQKDKAVVKKTIKEAGKSFRGSEYVKLTLSKTDVSEEMAADTDYFKKLFTNVKNVEVEVLKDAPSGTVIIDNGSEITDAGIQTQLKMIEELGRGKYRRAPSRKKADLNVIALVGERGREVREFIENDLGEEGMARSVVVVATSDQPAMMRNKCPMTATAIAEYFCSQGKDVLLMMDNLTRFAMAQREIGLSTGEPPVARGYTPSIYAAMPKLLERAGNFEKGSITGIYAVLVEGDDTNEPISDTVRGIIDGHIVLSRKIAAQNHYPAIDILPSISRLMSAIADPEHNKAAGKLRNLLALYNNNADLISIGAYKKGTNPALDEAIKKIDKINDFLMQGMYESFSMEDTIKLLKAAVS